jgi:predicted ATPase/DNA-binding CsgD family transcriptional regulator
MPAHVTHRLLGGNTMRAAEIEVAKTLVEPLTRREAQMLSLLAAGYSRSEIAAHLTLALSSVKFHLHHLYAKLGVNSKRQALSRARALGLLAPPPPADQPARPVGLAAVGRAAELGPAPRHNLPLQVTRFFGREAEQAQLRERLDENRLVTLTGPGGVGKTRLALRTAEELLPGYTDGVWLVEMAPLTDPALVAQQVAASLGLRDEPRRPILETLTSFLRDRQVLLVLDNCEHLLAACAQLADSLLRACPRVRLLASSRAPLGIAGEAIFAVPSLSFPNPDHLPPIDQMTDYAAVSLFLDRARLVLPDYQVAAQNAAALARICQRLDGIPLALEMAAARLNILNADQLAGRLDDVFRVLTGGSRSALPRQQTLRATIDWSYQLLSEPERRLFQRLAVFAGGCTLEAAEAVCADPTRGDGLEAGQVIWPAEIVDVLASLVSKSVVVADRQPDVDPRYHLLEFTRQYAREKLQEAGDSERRRRRHRDYFLQFAETNFPKLDSRDRLRWTRRLAAERENFRGALEWSFSDLTEVEAGPRLLMAMNDLWTSNQESVDWLKKGVAWCQSHAEVSERVYASVLGSASGPLALNDPQTALTWLRQAVDISRHLGPEGRETLMFSLAFLAIQYMEQRGDAAPAMAPIAEAEAIFLELGPDRFPAEKYLALKAGFAGVKAKLANSQGHYQDAKMQAGESVRLNDATGDRWGHISTQIELGTACLNLGEYAQARDTFLEALALIEESGDREKAYVLRWLGMVDFRQGQLERALDYCRDSLQEAARMPDHNTLASGLGVCAGIAAKAGQPVRAARLSGAAAALYATQKRKAWEDSSLDTLLPGWRAGPDAAAITAAFEAGLEMNVEQAMAFALSESAA